MHPATKWVLAFGAAASIIGVVLFGLSLKDPLSNPDGETIWVGEAPTNTSVRLKPLTPYQIHQLGEGNVTVEMGGSDTFSPCVSMCDLGTYSNLGDVMVSQEDDYPIVFKGNGSVRLVKVMDSDSIWGAFGGCCSCCLGTLGLVGGIIMALTMRKGESDVVVYSGMPSDPHGQNQVVLNNGTAPPIVDNQSPVAIGGHSKASEACGTQIPPTGSVNPVHIPGLDQKPIQPTQTSSHSNANTNPVTYQQPSAPPSVPKPLSSAGFSQPTTQQQQYPPKPKGMGGEEFDI